MNKYLTYTGTQPVYLGDIDFMQDAAKEGQAMICRSIADTPDAPNAILQGLVFSVPAAGQQAWTAGIIALAGEILPVAAGSISFVSGDVLYFHVSSTLSGTRTFKDGQSHECYETRVAVIDTVAADGVPVSSFKRVYHRPDDVKLTSNNSTGGTFAGVAVLERRNDVWYFQSWSGFPIGTNTLSGSIVFDESNGITAEIYNSIRPGKIPCLIAAVAEASYAFTTVEITKTAPLTITVSFVMSTPITLQAAGPAIIKTVISNIYDTI